MRMLTSGEEAIECTGDEPVVVLEVPGTALPIDWITLINEGDFPGFWRITSASGSTAWARLPAGGGEPGERKAAINIPCPGLSGGRLEVKRALLGGHLTGLFAFGGNG